MSRRGSAQLLLLFFRTRRGHGRMVGAIAGIVVVTGLLMALGGLPTPGGLAQVLRQNAWDRAFADLPEPTPLPWGASPATLKAKVTRLGLSASMVKEGQRNTLRAESAPAPAAGHAPHQPATMLSEVVVGDRITVTTAGGDSRVCEVTGRRVIDPHLTETDSDASRGDDTFVTCVPLDPLLASSLRLVIQATEVDPPAAEPRPEHKL